VSVVRIAPIVEGHGDVAAAPILLRRIWLELCGGTYAHVERPIRLSRSKFVQENELRRAVRLAALKFASRTEPKAPQLILLLLDADMDCPAELAPGLVKSATQECATDSVACVAANVEFETWFVAGASSLTEFLVLKPDEEIPTDPESQRLGKGWIQARTQAARYSETVDQPRMASRLNLRICRDASPSFDKLCRELERLLPRDPESHP
jgi:hypothetical protein